MRIILLVFMTFITKLSFAQEVNSSGWKTIYPVTHCMLLPIAYQVQPDGSYMVKVQNTDFTDFSIATPVADLNDLSILTESIVEKSEQLCPDTEFITPIPLTFDDGDVACHSSEQFFSDDYIDFVRFTADYVNKTGNQCDNMIPLIKLQDQITALEKEELLKFRPSKNVGHMLLKIITGKETDHMINQFQACGGKDGSDKFIQNMILLEAKKACIIPDMLSWDEAQQIAQDISKDYKNTNLFKLNKAQNQLSYDATMAFTNKVLEKEVEGMLGSVFDDLNDKNDVAKILSERKEGVFYKPDIVNALYDNGRPKNTKQFIKSLDSKKRLDKFTNKDKLADYVAYVFSVDAGIEIGQKAIPLFIESAFGDKLPSAWSEEEKDKFINGYTDDQGKYHKGLVDVANDEYDGCMDSRVKYSKYRPNKNDNDREMATMKEKEYENDLLKLRLETKENFCNENKEQCIEDSCDGSINMLQMDDTATDTEVIQGCVLKGITLSINPLLKGIIYDQKNEFKDDFHLSDEMAENFSDYSWNALVKCANQSIKRELSSKGKVDILNDEKPYQKINTDKFQTILTDCADIAENKVAPRFVDQIIINDPTIQKTFGDPKLVAKWEEIDKKYEGLLEKAESEDEKKKILEQWENDPEIAQIRLQITNSERNKIKQAHDNEINDIKTQIDIIKFDIKSETNPIIIAELVSEKEALENKIEQIELDKFNALKEYPITQSDDKQLQDISYEIVNTSFNQCIAKQYELAKIGFDKLNPKHGLEQKNTMLCKPIVEMNASLLVVQKELEKLVDEEGLKQDGNIQQILDNYENCGQQAVKNAISDVGSLASKTPINTVDQSKSYLDDNPSLFLCVQGAITSLSYQIAGKQFDAEIEAQKGKIKGHKYFASMKEEVQEVVEKCFHEGLSKLNNWSGLVNFNETDGLTQLQNDCSMKANQYVIPKLIVNETHLEMKSLIKDDFIKDSGQVGDVLFQASGDLRKKYDIPVRKDLNGGEKIDHYMAEALKIHIQKGGTTDSFVDEISQMVEVHAIKNVHTNLLEEIQNQTTNINERAKFSALDEYFSASCLQDIYNKFMKDTSEEDDSDPMKLGDLAGYMQIGLSYYENKSTIKFWEELKVLKAECNNMDKFKTEKDFHKSQFYQMIVKGQIYSEFKTDFKKGIMDSLIEQEKGLKKPHKEIKQKYINDMKSRMEKLLDTYLKEAAFDNLVFNDNTVSDFATDNLQNLLDKDQDTKDKLARMLIGKMFEKGGDNTFSDQFAQIMVEGNFGISGVEEAVTEGKKGKSILWGLMSVGNKSGEAAAKKYFGNINNIKNTIDWKTLPQDERKQMAKSIFYDAVAESQFNRSEKILDESVVWQAASGRSDRRFVDGSMSGLGYDNYKEKIETLTDEVTNGYINYEQNIETKARNYAKELLKSNPSFKKDFTEKELADHIAKDIKNEHMDRNVTDRLLKIKRNGKTIKDELKDDISDLGSDIFWRNTPEQKAAAKQRRQEYQNFKAENPLIGPKW
jgi:hypothetical protein